MKKLTIAAIGMALVLTSIASAQYDSGWQDTTIHSGPWMMRRSTGDKTRDRLLFIMDRTLNSCEESALKEMLWRMPGNTSYVLEKSIINAIDNNAKTDTNYGAYYTDSMRENGMSDMGVYNAMMDGLSWGERGVLYDLSNTATTTQMMAIAKLVKCGGWANNMWTTSGMNS